LIGMSFDSIDRNVVDLVSERFGGWKIFYLLQTICFD
jgi:hypothetical protein